MSAHTPGPWRVWTKYSEETQVLGTDGFVVADTGGVHLHESHDGDTGHWATTPGSRRELSLKEEEANARLIAAAPELLEALRAAFDALARPGGPDFGARGRDRGLPERMRLAIAKAGGQP